MAPYALNRTVARYCAIVARCCAILARSPGSGAHLGIKVKQAMLART